MFKILAFGLSLRVASATIAASAIDPPSPNSGSGGIYTLRPITEGATWLDIGAGPTSTSHTHHMSDHHIYIDKKKIT